MGVAGRRDLVGRDHELTVLQAALERGGTGRGAVIIVEGEAGIGKTRLLAETEDRARRLRYDTHRGAAIELEQGRPFGAFRNALGLDAPEDPATAGLATVVNAAAASADARFLAQEAVIEHVDRITQDRPTLLVLDDLQWADRATLATVWALARRVDPVPLVFLVARARTRAPPISTA